MGGVLSTVWPISRYLRSRQKKKKTELRAIEIIETKKYEMNMPIKKTNKISIVI